MMKISELFSTDQGSPLYNWITRFASPEELFAHLPELYAKLTVACIEGIVEEGAVIFGPVHVGADAVIHSQTIIRGPVIIGGRSVVHSHTEILPGSFIGSNCAIGHGCSIMRSMLLDNTTVGPAAFVRNSLIGFGSIVGPGAVLGAERTVLLTMSPHSSLELGVTLGDCSIVGANSTLKSGTIVGRQTTIGEAVLAEGIYESGQTVITPLSNARISP